MKALILAAGYATRLYPLTKEYPKPLLVVGKKPIIDYIIDKLSVINDIDEIVVVTNTKFIRAFRQWVHTLKIQKRITLVDDLTREHEDRRGAIGDMHFVLQKTRLDDDVLVVGGDNLFDEDLHGFLSFAKTNYPHPIIGIYDIRNKEHASKYGVVKLDAHQRIIDFQEKPQLPESTFIAMCLYYFPRQQLKLIREYMSAKSNKQDATGFYIDWLRSREQVYGFIFNGTWYDIGHHEHYKEANEQYSH